MLVSEFVDGFGIFCFIGIFGVVVVDSFMEGIGYCWWKFYVYFCDL